MALNGIEPANNILKKEIANGEPYDNTDCLILRFVRTRLEIDALLISARKFLPPHVIIISPFGVTRETYSTRILPERFWIDSADIGSVICGAWSKWLLIEPDIADGRVIGETMKDIGQFATFAVGRREYPMGRTPIIQIEQSKGWIIS